MGILEFLKYGSRFAPPGPRPLDRAGFKIIATGLEQCASDGNGMADADRAQLERLFLSLA
jgi:hypothetical protein